MSNRKKVLWAAMFLVVIALLFMVITGTRNADAEVVEEPIYVSFFWVGVSETDCIFKDTLITHSPEACNKEYFRVKDIIENLASEKKLNWGVILECGIFKTHDEYNSAVNQYSDKCVSAE